MPQFFSGIWDVVRAKSLRRKKSMKYELPPFDFQEVSEYPDNPSGLSRSRSLLNRWDMDVFTMSDAEDEYSDGEQTRRLDLERTAYGEDGDSETTRLTEDQFLVTWDGDEDPQNPLNWPRSKKWVVTWLVSCFTFVSPLASTMVAPALDTIADDLEIRTGFLKIFVMSVFLLGYAFGPFVIGPMSEIFGRSRVLQIANAWFLVFNLACGFAKTKEQMLAFRFLSGIGGSAPQAIGNGILADVWTKEQRGLGSSVYGLMTWLGPAAGPIAGAFCTQFLNWRWVFWVTSIFDLAIQVVAICFLRETFAPKLLRNKAQRMRKDTGNEQWHTLEEQKSVGQHMRKALVRPFVMLFTQPTIIVISFYRAFFYGIMYLVLSTFPMVWQDSYGFAVHIASLNYISLLIGFILGLGIAGPAQDWLYAKLKVFYSSPGLPEFRMPPLVLGTVLCAIGLLTYGWAAELKNHWVVPNIGAVFFAFGLIIIFQCAQNYLIDAYTKHAASAAGAAAFVRTMAGFSFPLFAFRMYDVMGVGGGNTFLAALCIFLGLPAAVILWIYGGRIRARSTYCAG